MPRAHAAAPAARKPSWNSTTSDLSQYKLSKEDLEERRRARQPKPLEAYSGPPAVTRRQREDGTWYVTGARPTSAAAMLASMGDGAPRRGRGRSVRSVSADARDGSNRGTIASSRSRSRSRSRENSTHIKTGRPVSQQSEMSYDIARRTQGSVCTTTADGALLDSCDTEPSDVSRLEEKAGDGANNSLNSEWDNLVLSNDFGSPPVKGEQEESRSRNKSPTQRAAGDTKPGQQHTATTKSLHRLKSGAMRVDSLSPWSGQKPARRPSIVAEVMADLKAHRDKAERDKVTELEHLSTACEVLRTKIVKYEFATGRHLQQPPPVPIERNPDVPGCYTDFLLQASARLYEYLGDSEKSREAMAADLQKVRATADTAVQEIVLLRAEMEAMRRDTAKQQHGLKQDFDEKVSKLEEEHQALAEQTASLFQSYEFEGVDSLLNKILGAPPAKSSASPQQASPTEISPDRWSSASTIDLQRYSNSPPDVVLTANSFLAHSKSAVKVPRSSGWMNTTSVAQPGECAPAPDHDPLAMTGGPRGRMESPDVDEYDVNEMHPLSPLSPQHSQPLSQQQELDDSADASLNDSQEERDDSEWDVARVAVPQPARKVTRVEMLKTQHMFGPPPLSPVHESPLEVCLFAPTKLAFVGAEFDCLCRLFRLTACTHVSPHRSVRLSSGWSRSGKCRTATLISSLRVATP